MTDRIITALLAVVIALVVIALAHLTVPVLAFAWFCAGGTVLVLLERIATTVMRTGWGVCVATRGGAAW